MAFSEVTSESAQALEAQRHSLVQEATAEMMRRDTRNQAELRREIGAIKYRRRAVKESL